MRRPCCYAVIAGALLIACGLERVACQQVSACNTDFAVFAASQRRHLSIVHELLVGSSTAASVLPNPASGITLFLPEDTAFGSLLEDPASKTFAYSVDATSKELAVNDLPASKVTTLLLFWSLPAAVDLQGLYDIGKFPSGLSLATESSAFDLSFVHANSTIGVSGQWKPAATIMRSYSICGSWVHTTSSLLWPSSTDSLAYLPDPVPGGRYVIGAGEDIGAETVFAPAVLAASANSASYIRRRAHLVPILAGTLGGILGAVLLLFAITMVYMHFRTKRKVEKARADVEAQLERDYLRSGGSASMRAKGTADAVLADMLRTHQETAKLGTSSTFGSSSSGGESRISVPKAFLRRSNSEGPDHPHGSRDQTHSASGSSAWFLGSMASSNAGQEDLSKGSLYGMDSIDSLQSLGPAWQDTSWQIDPSDVEIMKDEAGQDLKLGSGGYGTVYKGKMSGTTDVACKVVSHQTARELQRFAQEISILKDLRHINIVQFLGVYLQEGRLVLVQEFMSNGNLFDALGRDMQRDLSWYKRGQMLALDIVRGVLHMHSRRVLHLDLKSANVLLARDYTAKIADVGLSKVLSREVTHVSLIGSFDYMAPEVLTGQPCSEKVDIYSLGVILGEIVTGESPRFRQLRPIKVPEECPEEVRAVIASCRAATPADRPTARQVFDRLRACIMEAQ